ncbi:MAG: radical SAM protein [Candidatus Lokiarchaeota archaeon]|nr:radical SAM protein [Candidatus Lokiarchaeota archaeon]
MTKEDVPLAHAGMASQFDLQKEYYEKGKIFILQIESTLKCNQLCKYCYADSKPDSPDGLSSEKIMEILDSAAKMDIKMIDWLGGDPLIRKDWYELCLYAIELGFINNIWTSGIPLADPDVSRKAVEVSKDGFISTHLDTTNPELYALLHEDQMYEANPNNINLIIKGIKNTLKWGKNPEAMVNCITYTTPVAEGEAKSMISYLQDDFGIKTCLTLFNPVIHRKADKEWEPSISQIKDAFAYRDEINYPEDPSCGPMDVSKFYCGTVVCITADGWLIPCSVIRTKEFGNIRDKPLENLVEEKRRRLLFLDFRDPSKLPGNCSKCANNSYCFGCRSSAYYYAGDILAADPKCYHFQSEE